MYSWDDLDLRLADSPEIIFSFFPDYIIVLQQLRYLKSYRINVGLDSYRRSEIQIYRGLS